MTPAEIEDHINLLAESYAHLVGRSLVTGKTTVDPEDLENAAFALVSHGTERDPILNYGNGTALRLFEMTRDELTSTPSRLTAQPDAQSDRDAMMTRVRRDGFVSGYSGIRISSTGRKFRIENVTIWNVVTAAGEHRGQAAKIENWTFL